MQSLWVLAAPFLVVIGLCALERAAVWYCRDNDPSAPGPDQEALRRVIQRHTGREISELVLEHGHWYARTARGLEPVEELLRSGHVRMGAL